MARLYLLDDHAIVRDGLRAMLQGGGHEVVGQAGETDTALAEIAEIAPQLLLLDLGLGSGATGLDLLAELHRRGSPVRTIVLTMSRHPADVADALRLGAGGYLLKDCSRADLFEGIEAVLRGERHVDSAVQPPDTAGPADPIAALSPRERQIVRRVACGDSSATIGQQLGLSPKTVDTYRSRLMAKLGVRDLPALVRFAVRTGLVDVER